MSAPQPRLRPCWDGIAAWLLVVLGMALLALGWDHLVNGLELAAVLCLALGLGVLAGRMGGGARR